MDVELLLDQETEYPFWFILSGSEEIGYLSPEAIVDMEINGKNDFEMVIDSKDWNPDQYNYGHCIFIPDTEYGGMIDSIKSITKTAKVKMSGMTWRGMLTKKIVQPPPGSDHLILNGDLNNAINQLLGNCFGSFFRARQESSGVSVQEWIVDRYVDLLAAIEKLLDSKKHRLDIKYIEGNTLNDSYIELSAVPVIDYSEDIEYSEDADVDLEVKDYRGGINHLICLGEGQNSERIKVDLYVQADGSVGKSKYFKGIEEREAVYKYSGADQNELEKEGIKRLRELQNFKEVKANCHDMNLEIGDIIAGYDQITDTYVAKPIVGKILKFEEGQHKIEYKVKGDD